MPKHNLKSKLQEPLIPDLLQNFRAAMGLPVDQPAQVADAIGYFITNGYLESYGQPSWGMFALKMYGKEEITLSAEQVEPYLAKVFRDLTVNKDPDPEALLPKEPAPEQPSPDERYADGEFKYRHNP